MSEREIVVVGGGPAGWAAARALAEVGAEVTLLARPHPATGGAAGTAAPDHRTAALFDPSIELLRSLGLWQGRLAESAPITAIRLIDDLGTLLRAPEVMFRASEVGLPAFGYNVTNMAIVAALAEGPAHGAARPVELVATAGVTAVTPGADGVRLDTAEGQAFTARLVVAADGRASACRAAAGIATRTWTYDQSALVAAFTHDRPHHAVSNEIHRAAGPFTTVPLPGDASSLVWVERPAVAERLVRLSEPELRAAIEQRLGGLLGALGAIEGRGLYPLSGMTAERFAARRIALVGETAHVFPPIGAQGLNLSLRDAATLADCIADARSAGRDVGGEAALEAYHQGRRRDIASRVYGVDMLNRSLTSGIAPLTYARGLGLHILQSLPPLRHLAMRIGLEPPGPRPRLMQPGGGGRFAA